jgi:hypothetical protein
MTLKVIRGRKEEYDYHERLASPQLVIGVNDEEIVDPETDERVQGVSNTWDVLQQLAAMATTWKLDLEVRDEDGCTMAVFTLFERDDEP